MSEGFVIPTRQKTDVLFQSTTPLGSGGSFESPIARVDGYNQVAILAVSDQPFTIVVTEAPGLPPTLAQPQQALVPVPSPPPLPPPSPPPAQNPPPLGVGGLVQTQPTITSSAVGGQQQVALRIQPFGVFMQMVLAPTGASQTFLSFSALGIPLP
jgi:hypothetical protein